MRCSSSRAVRESLHISADDLHGLLGSDTLALLDTRTDDEYLAKNVRAARGGTIPGIGAPGMGAQSER